MRRLLFVVPALFLVACGGASDGGSSAPDQTADVAPAAVAAVTDEPLDKASNSDLTPFDPDAADLERLIFWDNVVFFPIEVPEPLQALLDMLLASDDPRAAPYLADLAALPNPYRDEVFDRLKERFDRPFAQTVYEFADLFPLTSVEQDSEAYLRFKRRLFASLVPTFGNFLHQGKPRTISAREVVWGGVGVDGIPPLELPRFITPDQAADWIRPRDEVIGVEINGDARAYPIRIIAWHEMVNDTIGGVPVSLAYCTLCGSAILYDGRVDGTLYRFGTSGLLYRSNKLMYDRVTGTLWNQFTGAPVWGQLVGEGIRLTTLPSVYTTWAEWVAAHPDTTVLDIETGFVRDYGPGVAYADYNSTPNPWFNVPLRDDRLRLKDDVYVVRVDDDLTAYPTKLLAELRVIHDRVGNQDVVIVATADGKGGRSFASAGLHFTSKDLAGGVLTSADGRTWRITESALVGSDGTSLERIAGHNAFWFAIANQTPNGRLYEPDA